MVEITLGDYTGYILLEISRAREVADRHSAEVAKVYAADPVLQHFSVPRFKIPRMELTIPVLISGARFTQTVRFNMALDQFVACVRTHLQDLQRSIAIARGDVFGRRGPLDVMRVGLPNPASVDALATELYQALTDGPDRTRPENLVTVAWARIVTTALEEMGLLDEYEKTDPAHGLMDGAAARILEVIRNHTVIDRTAIDSLLINPETNVVRDGSSDATVFTIKAELLEEGFYLRSVRDEGSSQPRRVVEFE